MTFGNNNPYIPPLTSVTDRSDKEKETISNLNVALSTSSLADLSSTYIPISPSTWNVSKMFPDLKDLNVASDFHTGAIIASLIDTVTLPYRTRNGNINTYIGDHLGGFSPRKNVNIASINGILPFPKLTLPMELRNLLSDLTPLHLFSNGAAQSGGGACSLSGIASPVLEKDIEAWKTPFSQLSVLRGVDTTFDSQKEWAKYCARTRTHQRQHLFQSQYAVPVAFPSFFQDKEVVNSRFREMKRLWSDRERVRDEREGKIHVDAESKEVGEDDYITGDFESLSILGNCSIGPAIQPVLQSVLGKMKKRDKRIVNQFLDAGGVTEDSLRDTEECLNNIIDGYYD